VYSPLSEAPDPYPLLEASVESLIVADEIVPKLESENKQLKTNNAKVTSQLEALEKQLEDERAARRTAENNRDSRVKEVEASWTAVLAEKQNNWEARERSLEERAENQERLLKELKASYEVTQRLERGDDAQGAAPQASLAELEMITAELERATSRIAEIEARNEQLRIDLAQSATNTNSSTTRSVEDDPAYLRLRTENSSLIRKLDAAKMERNSETRDLETAARALRKEIARLKDDSTSLRAKVEKWKDYEDVKRELDVLKSIEFNTGDTHELDNIPTDGTSQPGQTPELEQLLLARNKKLNDDLTVLRVSHNELQNSLEQLQDDLSSTSMELERVRMLNATLESDLARVQDDAAPSVYPAMSVAGRTQASRYPSASYGGSRRARFSPTSSIISGFDPASSGGGLSSLDSLRGGGGGGDSGGILPMVTAQRDRFKKRITELDAELAKSHNTVTSLRAEVAALQKDNLNLYEKTRYISSYNPSTQSSASQSLNLNSNPSTISMPPSSSSDRSISDRYRPAYESNLHTNPFSTFRGREQARALKRMSLPERGLLQATKWVFANRGARNAFGVYFLGLHLLMLVMLLGGGGAATGSASASVVGAGAGVATRAVVAEIGKGMAGSGDGG